MNTTRYYLRGTDHEIEAVRITKENLREVAAWCGGQAAASRPPGLCLKLHGITAFPGYWATRSLERNAFALCDSHAFAEAFSPDPTRLAQSYVQEGMNGAKAGAAERHRQITAEGWTPEHDDQWCNGELIDAAMCYAGSLRTDWPWHPKWFKPSTPKRNLEKAMALLMAEWDRHDRLERAVTAEANSESSLQLEELLKELRALPSSFHMEKRLHEAVTHLLTEMGIAFKAEERLAGRDRIDFAITLIDGRQIGLECKTKGGTAGDTRRQIYRYADHFSHLILLSAKPTGIESGTIHNSKGGACRLDVVELWRNPT